jgi:hypothetical protein
MVIDPSSRDHPCDIYGAALAPVQLGGMVIDARECSKPIPGKPLHVPGPLRIRANANVQLGGDLIWLVDDFDLSGVISITAKPGGGAYSLYVLKPWDPANTGQCATGSSKGIRMTGGGFNTGPNTKVMLYSSEMVDVLTSLSMTGQIYACDVRLGASTSLQYGGFGAQVPARAAGLELLTMTDVTK